MVCRSAILVGVMLGGALGTAVGVEAQALEDLQTPDTPLVLKAQGSFFVGGEKADQLVVFGDHRDTPTGISTRPSWQLSFQSCQALIGRVKAAGGDAQRLNPPDRGIRGNSHMIMQDKNHLQIADLILQWISAHVSRK
jgi:hypothetical protein